MLLLLSATPPSPPSMVQRLDALEAVPPPDPRRAVDDQGRRARVIFQTEVIGVLPENLSVVVDFWASVRRAACSGGARSHVSPSARARSSWPSRHRRRQPRPRGGLTASRGISFQGVPRRRGWSIKSSGAVAGEPALLDGLVPVRGRRAGRVGVRGGPAARAGARAGPRRRDRRPRAAGRPRGGAGAAGERHRLVRRRRSRRAAAARGGPRARCRRSPRSTAGDVEARARHADRRDRGVATASGARTCAARSSACWTRSASSTPSRVSRGGSWRPRSTSERQSMQGAGRFAAVVAPRRSSCASVSLTAGFRIEQLGSSREPPPPPRATPRCPPLARPHSGSANWPTGATGAGGRSGSRSSKRRQPHAQQPHRLRRRVRVQQLHGRRRHQRHVVRGIRQRPRPRHRRPVRQPHLDRDRAPAAPLLRQPLAQLARQPAQHRLQLGMRRDVLVEGPLGRDRLGRAGLRLDRRVVDRTTRAPSGSAPSGRRSAPRASASSASWSCATVAKPIDASRSAVFGPIPGSRRVGAGREADARLLAPHRHEAGGLARGPSSTSPPAATARSPTEIWMPVSARTAATSSRSTRSGFSTPVRSAYASSSPIDCTRSSRDRTSAHTSRDFSR